MTTNYRLIWFQHFHKAAGTFIMRLALNNQEKLYPKHKNGNPFNSDGKLIRLWEMSKEELTHFVDHCENEGITFVATEWGAPNLRLLASDPRVTIITCLRDPLERFISNFNFDFWSGYTHCKSIEEYVNSSGSFTMFNYYCRILSQHNENPKPITIREFQEAKFLLSLFDYLVILEKQDTFWGLNEFLGWEEKVMRQKQNQLKKRKLVKFFKRKKFALDWKQLTNHQIKPDQNFLKKFREFNEFDNQIYLDAKTKNLLNL